VDPAADQRRRRVPVEIDDDYFPAYRPPGAPVDPPPAAPPRAPEPVAPPVIEPAAAAPFAQASHAYSTGGDAQAVPVWAVRSPTPPVPDPFAGPQFSADLSLDPMSLRRKATVRSGASSVQVDEDRLRLRTWFRRHEIPWSDILGFEAHYDSLDEVTSSTGHLVALTVDGPVELPGTVRSMGELRYVHALLDAYRIRAQRLAAG
jgi:hypothetical protein